MSSFICSEKVKRLQPYPPVSFSLSLTVLFPAGSSSQVFMIARHGNRSILKKQILFHRRYTDGWVFTGTFYSHKNEACDSTIGRSENKTKDIKKREMKGGEWFCLFVYLFQDLKNRVWGGWDGSSQRTLAFSCLVALAITWWCFSTNYLLNSRYGSWI